MDIAAIKTMTDAMAGTNKPFIMSSGSGLLGDTGLLPVSEEFPVNPRDCLTPPGSRVLTERVRAFFNFTCILCVVR